MNTGYSGPVNELDRIRRARGADACRDVFRKSGKENRQNAVRLLNDSRLYFATLFILQPDIKELDLNQALSERNRTALSICEKIADAKNPTGGSGDSVSLNNEAVHFVLMWMFYTGAADDGLSNQFDQTFDIVASVLIKTHHEKAILPVVADLIFQRNQKGSYLHDLVWVFFQARDANALRLIAGHLRSPVQKEVELARTLLNLSEDVPLKTNQDKQRQYVTYLSWLRENSPYVYFTGESFQLTNSPIPCGVNQEAKYLCKNISPRSREPLVPLTESERTSLMNFNDTKEEEKIILAEYSQKLHAQNTPSWNEWIQLPVSKQIQSAKYGRRDFV
jgi:hypothetical protein